jgi:L-lactate dehydrogenase (cytochrome)
MAILKSLRSVVRFRRVELDRTTRLLARSANVDDLRRAARRRLPGGVFDYIDGAADDERSLQRNGAGYAALEFEPNVLCDVSDIRTDSTLLGRPIAAPLVLAPTGFTRIADPQGELAVARAAGRAGLPYTLSTLSTRSIEEVAAVGTAPLWFQVYVWKDRGLVSDMIARAQAAGYQALVVTVDTAVLGRRERDVRRGFTLPPKVGLDTILSGVSHPRWSWQLVTNEPITFANVANRSSLDGTSVVSLSEYVNDEFDQALSWHALDWIREASQLPIILKGIQRVDDAKRAVSEGIPAIALSNHGGRQLDDAPSPIELLPRVMDAVGDSIEVICDGGVRRGSDVVKACALGARAVMFGRAYLYGLGAAGERGVDFAIDHLVTGMRRTMALVGRTSVSELTADLVRPRPSTRP